VDEKLLGGFAALTSAVRGIGSLLLSPSPSSALASPLAMIIERGSPIDLYITPLK